MSTPTSTTATEPSLTGQVIVITGSTRGVGRALAGGLATAGAHVVLNGRTAETVAETVAELRASGLEATGAPVDLVSEDGAQRLLEAALGAYSRVDAWINNAGVNLPGNVSLLEQCESDWQSLWQLNVSAPLRGATAALGWMKEHQVDGRVLNISSGAVLSPVAGLGSYTVTKCALEALTSSLSADLGELGAAVATVQLGSLQTDMTRDYFGPQVYEQLPLPESVLPLFQHLLTAPLEAIRGRTFAAWRWLADAAGESAIHGPVAVLTRKKAHQRMVDEQPLDRSHPTFELLDRGENPHGTPAAVLDALGSLARTNDPSRYPLDPDYPELRRTLAEQLSLPLESFSFGNGSSEIVERAVQTFAQPGDEVISHYPTWFMFDRYCDVRGAIAKKVPFIESNGLLGHNLDGVLAEITPRTRLIYLVSPGNPIGLTISKESFHRFLEQLPKNLPVLIDEAYIEFADDPDALRLHEIVLETDHRLIASRTFSKFYGLAGLRVGYAYASPETMKLFDRLETLYGVSTLSAAAATLALTDTVYAETTREILLTERKRIEQSLLAANIGFLSVQTALMPVVAPGSPTQLIERLEAEGIFIPLEILADRFVLFPIGAPETNDRILKVLGSLSAEVSGAPLLG